MAAFRWNGGDFAPLPIPGEPFSGDKAMSESKRLLDAAGRVIPGGVNSPVRAFRAVGGAPPFIERGEGARLWDVDGRSYIDFVGSWGPLILGHAAPAVVEAVTEAARRGTSYGAPTALEVEMAQTVTTAYPSMEMVRLVSSGTEAAMSAIRVARGATGRDVLVKFDGCYHGHADSLLVKAGSGGATFGIPDSKGVPAALAELTLTVAFNDLEAVRDLFRRRGDRIAAVIVEPVAGNMGRGAAGAGLPGGPARGDAHAWRTADLRRGDHRLSRRLRRRPGEVRRAGRSHVPGQDHRGRPAGRRLRRAPADHARGLAARRRVPGRHAIRQSARGGRWPGRHPRAEPTGARTRGSRRSARGWSRGCVRGADKAGVPLTVNRVGSMLTAFFCSTPVT
jgi:hypothetical protein